QFFLLIHHTSTPQISTLSLHDALPISLIIPPYCPQHRRPGFFYDQEAAAARWNRVSCFIDHIRINAGKGQGRGAGFGRYNSRQEDRKSTRLNSSHLVISYAVFCLKKKI